MTKDQIIHKIMQEVQGIVNIGNGISDSFYCYPLAIELPVGGNKTEKIQAPGHNVFIYNMKGEVYLDNVLQDPIRDEFDLITIDIQDKKNGKNKFSFEPVPITTINAATNNNFPGFKLAEDTLLEFTVNHSEGAWTTGNLKVIVTLIGQKIA